MSNLSKVIAIAISCIFIAVTAGDLASFEESFLQTYADGQSTLNTLSRLRFGQGVRITMFSDRTEPQLNSTQLKLGNLVQGTHISAPLGKGTSISATIVKSAQLSPIFSQRLQMRDFAIGGSSSLSCWRGARGNSLFTMQVDDTASYMAKVEPKGSLTRYRLEHSSNTFKFEFEKARVGKDLLLGNGTWVSELNEVAPLPRSLNALRGYEFSTLSLCSKIGSFNADAKWHSLSGSGEVERQSVSFTGHRLKMHLGKTSVESGALLTAEATGGEAKALASEFESLSKEFKLLGAPAITALQSFSKLRESERLFVYEPSNDFQLRHESINIGNASMEVSQEANMLTLFGGKFSAISKRVAIAQATNTQFLKSIGREAMANLIGCSQSVTQFTLAPSKTFQVSHSIAEVESSKGAQTTRMTSFSLQPDKSTSASLVFGDIEDEGKPEVKLMQWSLEKRLEFGGHSMTLSNFWQRMKPDDGIPTLLKRMALSFSTNPKSATKFQLNIVHTNTEPDSRTDGTYMKMALQSPLSKRASLAATWESKPTPIGSVKIGECNIDVSELKLRYSYREEPTPQGIEHKVDQFQLHHPISDEMGMLISVTSVEHGDERVDEKSLTVMSEKQQERETLIKFSMSDRRAPDSEEQTQSVVLLHSVTKDVLIATELSQTGDGEGNKGEQHSVYIAATAKSDMKPQVHIGYTSVRPPSGEANQAPLVRLSLGKRDGVRVVVGYALNQTRQYGQMPMRELVFQLPLGRAKIEVYRFLNMPQNWITRWSKESWFSRASMSPFPTLPTGQKLSQLSLVDWGMVSLSATISKGWTLQVGAHKLNPYAQTNLNEGQDVFAILQGNLGKNGKLHLSFRKVSERQSSEDVKGLIYAISYAWRVPQRSVDECYFSLSAHYNTNQRIQRPPIPPGAYSLTLSFSFRW